MRPKGSNTERIMSVIRYEIQKAIVQITSQSFNVQCRILTKAT